MLELVEGPTLADRIARGPMPLDRGADHRASDRRSAGSGAREGHHPSRPQAGEHQDHPRRRGQGARLRAGEGVGRRARQADLSASPTADRRRDIGERTHPGHAGVHEPGTGAWRSRWTSGRTSGRSAACSTRCSPGRAPFAGDTISDTLAAILEREPDWAALPADRARGGAHADPSMPGERSPAAHRGHLGRAVRPRRPRECCVSHCARQFRDDRATTTAVAPHGDTFRHVAHRRGDGRQPPSGSRCAPPRRPACRASSSPRRARRR